MIKNYILFTLVTLLYCTGVAYAATPAAPDFPLTLASYQDSHLSSLWDVLTSRAQREPLNLLVTFFFLCAVIHTFLAPKILKIAKKLEDKHRAILQQEKKAGLNKGPEHHKVVSFRAVLVHYLGEIEAVFGIWAIPLFMLVATSKGWTNLENYVNHGISFTEPIFVVVVMAIAGTKPILYFARKCLTQFANIGSQKPSAWWFVVMTLGTLMGSFITEPAAMTICALLLAEQFYSLKPSTKLAYASVGLLFVNISIGGTLTHFAAPPVLMVAGKWGWDFSYMFSNFGWKAIIAIIIVPTIYLLLFKNEFKALDTKASALKNTGSDLDMPWTVVIVHLLFLAWTVFNAHSPNLLILGLLFFTAFVEATNHHQFNFSLRGPLLVGFFLAGLVLHGGFQAWWIDPVMSRLDQDFLYFGALTLSAFNDNAAITYLASLVPSFSEPLKYSVVAGAVAGGGLTIIANAPNPAGNAILSKYFEGGISPLNLFLAALFPTIIASVMFILL